MTRPKESRAQPPANWLERRRHKQPPIERFKGAMSELMEIKESIDAGILDQRDKKKYPPALNRLHDLIQTLPATIEAVSNDPDMIREVKKSNSRYTIEPGLNELQRRELIDERRKEAFYEVFNRCLENPEPNTDTGLPPQISEFFGKECIWNIVKQRCLEILSHTYGQRTISNSLAQIIGTVLWDIELKTGSYINLSLPDTLFRYEGESTPIAREMARKVSTSGFTSWDLQNWATIRDSQILSDASGGIFQVFDQKYYEYILKRINTKFAAGNNDIYIINSPYYYPTPETIRFLIHISLFGSDGEAPTANRVLTNLASRNDWQTHLSQTLTAYPELADLAEDLANFEFRSECRYPVDPAVRESIAATGNIAVKVDENEKSIQKPVDYWLRIAQLDGYITKEEAKEFHQAIYLIRYMEGVQRVQGIKIPYNHKNAFIDQIGSTISNYLIRNRIIGQPGNSANTDAGRAFKTKLKNLAMLANAIRRHRYSYEKIEFLTAYEVVRAIENLESFTIKEFLEEEPEDQRPMLLLAALEKILAHPPVATEMAPAYIAVLLHCLPVENRRKLDGVLAFFIETFSSMKNENIAERSINAAYLLNISRRMLGMGDMDASVRGVLEPNNLYTREEAQIEYILAFVQRAAELEKERFAATPILSEVPKRIEFPRVELEGSFIDPLGDIQPTMGIELDTSVAGFRFSNPRVPISFPSEQAALLKQTGIEIDEHGGRTSIDQGIYELALPPALSPNCIFPVYDEVARTGWLNTLHFNPHSKDPVSYQIGTRIHVTFGDAPMYDEISGANMRVPPELRMAIHTAETTGYALPADEWVMEPFATTLHNLVVENKETAQKMLAEALADPLYLFWKQIENISNFNWEQLIIFYDNPRGDLEPVDERSFERQMQTPGYSRNPDGRLYQTRAAHNRDPVLSRLYLRDLSTSWICFSELARTRQTQDDHQDLSAPLYVKYQNQLTSTPWEKLDEASLEIIRHELPANEINEHLNHYRTIASTGALKLATASHAIGKRFNLQYDTQWNSHSNPKHDLMDGTYTHNDLFVRNRTRYPKAWDDTQFRQTDPSGAFRERVKIALLARLSHPNIIENLLGPEARHAGNYLTELTAGGKSFRSPAHLMQETLAEIGQKLEIAQQEVYRAFKKELSQVVMGDPKSIENFTRHWRTKRAERNGFSDPRDFISECRKRANLPL